MKIDATIKLIDGIDQQEFFDSLPKEKIQLYTMEGTDSLSVRIEQDFFNTLSEMPQVVEVLKDRVDVYPCAAPPYPILRYHQGIPSTSTDSDISKGHGGFQHPRPEFGSTESIENQKITIHNNKAKKWLGTHFMGVPLWHDMPHRYNDPSGNSTRPSIGNCSNDTYTGVGPYGHTLNPVTTKTDTQYESRFFGRNVDIIFLEGGGIFQWAEFHDEDLRVIDHPEFKRAASNDLNILGNDSPTLGDAPNGNYVHPESRIILKNWGNQRLSSGTNLGGKGSLLSRYNNTNLSDEDRAPISSHMAMVMSVGGGLVGGFAKDANLYPMYTNTHSEDMGKVMNTIIDFHENKPINPETGLQNPTILSCSFASGTQYEYFHPIDSIKSLTHLGVTTERPDAGWGSDYSVFVRSNIIPIRTWNPVEEEWVWAVGIGDAGHSSDGIKQGYIKAYEKVWNAGVAMCIGASNQITLIARTDDPEYNTYFKMDNNSKYFENTRSDGHTRTGIKTLNAKSSKKFYPYRTAHATKRNTNIIVAAGQNSDRFPLLDTTTGRGPGVDIIGNGSGCFSASKFYDVSESYKTEVPSDTNFGQGADLDPNSSMYSSVTYPFTPGQKVRIDSLGTASQANWTTYAGAKDTDYAVGDTITLPNPITTNIPAGAKISEKGWFWAEGGGTSSACPSVAGRLACMAEEYLHREGVWPTNNQLRGLLLSSARQVDLETYGNIVDWTNTPSAGDIDNPNSDGQQFVSIGDDSVRTERISSLEWSTNAYRGTTNDFMRREGEIGPSTLGWFPENMPSTTFTLDKSTVLDSSVEVVEMANYTHRYKKYDEVVFESTLRSTTLSGFKDTNNNAINFKEGDILEVTGEYSRYISRSQYIVVEATRTVVKLHEKYRTLNKKYEETPLLTWSNIPADDLNGLTFTVTQLPTKSEGIESSLSIKNEAGQSSPAGAYTFLELKKGEKYQFFVDSTRPIDIDLKRINRNTVDENGDSVDVKVAPLLSTGGLNFSNTLGSGTITPEEAKTSVMLVGTKENGTAYAANTRLWDQMSRAVFDFDKNGAADALTDGLLFLRYLFHLRDDALLDQSVALDSPLSDEEVMENLRIAEQTFADIDGNGEVDALTDGLLLFRYLFNLTGDALIGGTIGHGATRTTSEQVVAYIDSLLPQQTSGTFGYRSGTNSAVPSNYLTDDLGSIGQLVTAEIDSIANNAITFKTDHGLKSGDSFMLVANGHPTVQDINRRIFTTGSITTTNRILSTDTLSQQFGDFHMGPYDTVQVYKVGEEIATHTVNLNDPALDTFTTPVAAEMFDNRYFRDPDPFRDSILKDNKPWTPYKNTAWRWTQLSGQFLNTDLGSLSTNTFTDASSVTRTIRDMWWTEGQDAWNETATVNSTPFPHEQTPNGIFCFSLEGTNIANSNNTFGSINVNGVTFERGKAFYSPDSNGNTVWWWHIQNQPLGSSVIKKLGTSITEWTIAQAGKIQPTFVVTEPDNTTTSSRCFYRLYLKNVVSTAGYETLINSIHCHRFVGGGSIGMHINHKPGDVASKYKILGEEDENEPEFVGFMVFHNLEPCGTPPLRANYIPGKIYRNELKSISAFKSNSTPDEVVVGATFPANSSTLTATTDITELEAGLSLTKYGWQRRKPEPFTLEDFTPDTNPIDNTVGDPEDDVESLELTEVITYNLIITTTLPDSVVVPSNGTFHVGPLSITTGGAPELLRFQWQKSTDGNTWTNISSTDATYTNALTNKLTVTNYSNQAPVGDYYRCRVSDVNPDLDIQFELSTTVEAVSS